MNVRPGSAVTCLLAGLMLAASGCAQLRRSPAPEPVPPPPPVVVEARTPVDMVAGTQARSRNFLALAEAAMIVGLDEGADLLLGGFIRTAPVDATAERARALVLRALVALRRGGEPGREAAADFLQAARQIEPLGSSAPGITMTLGLLSDLEARGKDLEQARARLAASRKREGQEQADAEGLRAEVELLKQQLDELKKIHVRIESDKQDAPPDKQGAPSR